MNDRFNRGRQASKLADAGLLIHQFDGTDDCYSPGKTLPWEIPPFCQRVADRVSAVLVSRDMPLEPSTGTLQMFSDSLAGWVLSPEVNRLLCAYAFDGASHHRHCQGAIAASQCVPGCTLGPGAWVPFDDHWNATWTAVEQYHPWRAAEMWW